MCVLDLLAMSLNFSVSVINFCWDDLSTGESEVWTSRPVAVLVSMVCTSSSICFIKLVALVCGMYIFRISIS